MTAPTSCFFAARSAARAESYAIMRMLIAGTVKPDTSPLPRAR
jgi:hypothetical protein